MAFLWAASMLVGFPFWGRHMASFFHTVHHNSACLDRDGRNADLKARKDYFLRHSRAPRPFKLFYTLGGGGGAITLHKILSDDSSTEIVYTYIVLDIIKLNAFVKNCERKFMADP